GKIVFELRQQRAIFVARHADRFRDRSLFREAPVLRAKVHLRAEQIDYIFDVAAIENREIRLQADHAAHLAQDLVGERMEGTARDLTAAVADQLLDPPQHLLRRAPGKGQQEYRAGRDSALDQPGDPIDERARLAGAGAGDHQQRAFAMGYGGELLRIQDLRVADTKGAFVDFRPRRPVS